MGLPEGQPAAHPAGGSARSLWTRGRSASPAVRVWIFSAFLATLALLLYGLFVTDDTALATPFQIPWWLVAGAFALADIKVIEVHFRRESHAFSLTEVPAVIGLFFLSPSAYVAGHAWSEPSPRWW